MNKRVWLLLVICLGLPMLLQAQPVERGGVNVRESDGSPDTFPWQINVSNGTLTDNADGTVTVTTGGGGGTSGWTDNGTDVNLTTSTDNVGIGGTSLGKLSVDGDTDEIQLLIQGNVTQTSDTFVVEKSTGTDLTRVTNTGVLVIGADTATGVLVLTSDQATDYQLRIQPGNMTRSSTYRFPPADGSNGQVLTTDGTGGLSWTTSVTAFGVTIDGGGSVPKTGTLVSYVEIPYAMTITGWTMVAQQTGTMIVDVWKDTYANYPPTVADSIAGTEKPTLTNANKNQDLSLSTWTTAVSAGDVVAFNIDSVNTITGVVTITIRGNKA